MPPRVLPQNPEIAALAVKLCRSRGDKRGSVEEGPDKFMTVIRHAAVLEKTPVREAEAPMGLNVHSPTWLPIAYIL